MRRISKFVFRYLEVGIFRTLATPSTACVHAQDTRAGVLVPLAGSLDEPDWLSLPGSVFDAQCFDAHARI
jgi:hypothetical protein